MIQSRLPRWPDRDIPSQSTRPVVFPEGVRMAKQGDEERLFTLFVKGHAENGVGDYDKETVMKVFARACRADGIVIAVIDGPDGIEGAIGFIPEKGWQATNDPKNYYNTNILFYVDSDHRHTRHAQKLVHFAEWLSQESGMPTFLGLIPKSDFARKQHFFSRFGPQVGAFYLIGPSSFDGVGIPS